MEEVKLELKQRAIDTVTSVEEAIIGPLLTPEQEHVVNTLYDDVKAELGVLMSDASLAIPVKIMKVLSGLIKLLQDAKVGGEKLKGSSKKAIALALLHRLAKELIADSTELSSLLASAEEMADHMLETLVDIGKSLHLPPAIEEGCCAFVQVVLSKK